jgi:predicted transcriptional regulator
MKLPCEITAKSLVPAIRALLAKELIITHGMKQIEAANLLGITQTAISKYAHNVRGRVISIEEDKEITERIKKTATSITEKRLDRTEIAVEICYTCRLVREKRLMCSLCKQADKTMDIENCTLCSTLLKHI